MLIIGDYASVKHINTKNPKVLEIIYENSERDYILNKLGIDKKPFYSKDNLEYYYKDKVIKLYNCTGNITMTMLYNKNLSSRNIRLASLFFNFAVYKSKINFRNKDIKEWESDFITYLKYKEKLINNTNKEKLKWAISNSHLLTYYTYLQQNSNTTHYQYNTYLVYDRFELYSLLSENLNSPYELMMNDKNNHFDLDYKTWCKYDEYKKLDSVMECLYVDNAIEYLIPQIEADKGKPIDDFECFMYCIMNLMTTNKYPKWLQIFVENNFFDIIDVYSDNYVNNLYQLIKYDVLKKVN